MNNAQFAAERAATETAARLAQMKAERQAEERAARPLGERLVEARCLGCHDAAQIGKAEHGLPSGSTFALSDFLTF